MVWEAEFIDTDPEDMSTTSTPHIVPASYLGEEDEVNDVDMADKVTHVHELNVNEGNDVVERSDDEDEVVDECLDGWNDEGDGVSDALCDHDDTMIDVNGNGPSEGIPEAARVRR